MEPIQVGETVVSERQESQTRESYLGLGGERSLMRLEDSLPTSLATTLALVATWPHPTSIQPTPCGTHILHDPCEFHACVSPSP